MRGILITLYLILCLTNVRGQEWDSLSIGVGEAGEYPHYVTSMTVFNNNLVVAGWFLNVGNIDCKNIAVWDGIKWDTLPGGGPNSDIYSMCTYQNDLYVGGLFSQVGNVNNTAQIAGHNGTGWFNIGQGGPGAGNNVVYKILPFKNTLVLGGNFTQFGGLPFNGIGRMVRWMGSYYDKVSGGITNGMMTSVSSIEEYNGKLYVGGDFTKAGSISANNIATWDGGQWDSLGSGANGPIYRMFQDTMNNELYIFGGISKIDGTDVYILSKYDGYQWHYIPPPSTSEGFDIEGFYNGYIVASLDKLYPGDTTFTLYDGINWIPILEGPNSSPSTICEYHDTLYVGGSFDSIGTKPIRGLAKFFIPQNPNSIKPILERKTRSELFTNVPNPFDEETSIGYNLPKGQKGRIKVFNGSGVCVRELNLKSESNKVVFKTEDLENGIYYYSLVVNEMPIQTKKMIICK